MIVSNRTGQIISAMICFVLSKSVSVMSCQIVSNKWMELLNYPTTINIQCFKISSSMLKKTLHATKSMLIALTRGQQVCWRRGKKERLESPKCTTKSSPRRLKSEKHKKQKELEYHCFIRNHISPDKAMRFLYKKPHSP